MFDGCVVVILIIIVAAAGIMSRTKIGTVIVCRSRHHIDLIAPELQTDIKFA
jgi:hypothetical protein